MLFGHDVHCQPVRIAVGSDSEGVSQSPTRMWRLWPPEEHGPACQKLRTVAGVDRATGQRMPAPAHGLTDQRGAPAHVVDDPHSADRPSTRNGRCRAEEVVDQPRAGHRIVEKTGDLVRANPP